MTPPVKNEDEENGEKKSEVYEKLRIHFEYIQRMQPSRIRIGHFGEPTLKLKSSEEKWFISCCSRTSSFSFCCLFFPLCSLAKKKALVDDSANIW